MFIGRENELKNLNELYQQNKFQLFVLYGRRRIGKTTLIREFLKNKKAIFFIAQEANDYMNLLLISKKYMNFLIYHYLCHLLTTGMLCLILFQKKPKMKDLY